MAPTSTISRSGSREKAPVPNGEQDLTALLTQGPSGPGRGPPQRQGQPHPLHRWHGWHSCLSFHVVSHTSDLVFRSPFLALILPIQSS